MTMNQDVAFGVFLVGAVVSALAGIANTTAGVMWGVPLLFPLGWQAVVAVVFVVCIVGVVITALLSEGEL